MSAQTYDHIPVIDSIGSMFGIEHVISIQYSFLKTVFLARATFTVLQDLFRKLAVPGRGTDTAKKYMSEHGFPPKS